MATVHIMNHIKAIGIIVAMMCTPHLLWSCPTQGTWEELSTADSNHAASKTDRCALEAIAAHWIFTPKQTITQSSRIALIIVHGSYSAHHPDYSNNNHPTFQAIKNFAQRRAESACLPIEVLSFRWSGHNSDSAREMAASMLANFVDSQFGDRKRYQNITTLSHSHGGNVVMRLTHIAKRPIDAIINIFTPNIVGEPRYVPRIDAHTSIYNIYSPLDSIQLLGAIRCSNIIKLLKNGGAREMNSSPEYKLFNIRMQVNALYPDHFAKQPIIQNLHEVLDIVATNYLVHRDLDVNIINEDGDLHAKKRVVVTIRRDVPMAIQEAWSAQHRYDFINRMHFERGYSAHNKELFQAHYPEQSIHTTPSFLDSIHAYSKELIGIAQRALKKIYSSSHAATGFPL